MKEQAVIFDCDGTLHDVRGIRHLLSLPGRNFDAFHEASIDAPPHQWVVDAARTAHDTGLVVVVVTARKARWWWHTALWLREWDVPHRHLAMRPDWDQRPDVEVKRDILRRVRRHYDVVQAWDDNPAVIDLWRNEGIPVTVVPGWDG